MNAIKGRVHNGQVVLDEEIDWPENTQVVVKPLMESLGIHENDWQDTPEAIAEWLRWYDTVEPLDMSAEQETAWRAALQEQKDLDKARTEQRDERIKRIFE